MKKTAFILMLITILSKILGFGREMVLSYVYGASAITDAYIISETIPKVIFTFISGAISTGFVPLYSRILNTKNREAADQYASNLSNALFLLCSIVIILIIVFAEPFVRLFATGFKGETFDLAIRFTRISVFGVYFTALLNVFSGYLRIYNNYIAPALVNISMNLVIITSIVTSSKLNIYILAVGSVFATASQFILLIPYIRKTGFIYCLDLNLNDDNLKAMVILALPIILGRSVNQINTLIDRTLASSIAIGGISTLNYATRMTGFVEGLFVASVTTAIYPVMSKIAAQGNVEKVKSYIAESISIVSVLVIPTTFGAMYFSEQLVGFLFGRGAFTPEAVNMTAIALFYYSIGMVAFGFRDILSRAFYALQDTKTPMINATIGVVINIVLNFILSKYMGIGGLALATSISAIVTAILMFITLRKKIGPFGLKELLRSFIKISIASLIMGLFAYSSFSLAGNHLSQNLSLIIAIGVGALSYAIIIYFMKIPEVDSTILAIKNKLKSYKQKEQN